MDTDALIAAVFKNPAIWDKRIKDHANRNVIDKTWKEISKELNIGESQLRKKWKSLRDYFVAECNRIQKARSGDAANTDADKSKWQYFNAMLFIKDIVTHRASSGTFASLCEARPSSQMGTGSNIETESVASIESLSEDLDSSQLDADHLITPLPLMHQSPVVDGDGVPISSQDIPANPVEHRPQTERETKKRRMDTTNEYKEFIETEKRKLDYLTGKSKQFSEEEQNDDLLFFKSLLPYTKMMSPSAKLLLRSRILNAVTELAFGSTPSESDPGYRSQHGNVSSYITNRTAPSTSNNNQHHLYKSEGDFSS